MWALLLTAAMAASPARSCLVADSTEVVTTRKAIRLGKGKPFEAVTLSRKGDGPLGFISSRAVVYSATCHIAYAQEFDGSASTRLSTTVMGEDRVLVLTTFHPGGSACGYGHVVLKFTDNHSEDLSPIAHMDMSHSNMGGFFVGNAGHLGPRIVRWDPIWAKAESHYDPHRYRIITYRWKNGRFGAPTVRTTKQKFDPSPNEVATRLGLPIHDLTDQSRFDDC